MEKFDLKKVWEIEFEILSVIDSICKKNNIKYSLAYGTLLGAVRHGGFIPWDDDLDIIMPAEDYYRFIEVCKTDLPKDYILQNKYTEEDFRQNFTKIRKNNTLFLHSEKERKFNYHKGIFVDVFPGYYVPSNKIVRKIQYVLISLNLLFSREYTSGASGIASRIERGLLSLDHKHRMTLFKITEKMIFKIGLKSKKIGYVFPSTIEWGRKVYPITMFDGLDKIQFENKMFLCVKDRDEILTLDYGEYLKLPPTSERVLKHHPIAVSYIHN